MITLLLITSLALAKEKPSVAFINEVKKQHRLSNCDINNITKKYFNKNCTMLHKEKVFKTFSSIEIKLYCVKKDKTTILISSFEKIKNIKNTGLFEKVHICTDKTTTFYTMSYTK